MHLRYATFADPSTPVSLVAFGGPLDLARLVCRHGHSAVEVCEACQTINLGSARFCKGCDGKLPAYYAALGSGDTDLPRREVQGTASHPRGASLTALGLAVVLGAAAFASLAARYASSSSQGGPSASALQSPPATAHMDGGTLDDHPDPATTQATLAADPMEEPPAPSSASSSSEARATDRDTTASWPARKPAARARPPVPASALPGAQALLAQCGGLNFVSRAICLNNRCAQRTLKNHPDCVQAVRQRRIDEARRNPTLIG